MSPLGKVILGLFVAATSPLWLPIAICGWLGDQALRVFAETRRP